MNTALRAKLISFVAVSLSASLLLAGAPAAAQATHTLGIDVSHHQGDIDWSQVAQSGHVFAFAKASEGATFTDPKYAQNRSGAGAEGISFGAYHFARPQGTDVETVRADAIAEADHFLSVAQPTAGDLLPVLDLEVNGGLDAALLTEWAQAWVDRVRTALESRVIIYSNPSFWRTSMGDTTTFAIQGLPLWIANYTSATSPSVPAANWNGSGWTLWQWTSCATVPGVTGCTDENRSSNSDLSSLTIPAPGSSPTPSPAPSPSASEAMLPINSAPPSISGSAEVGGTLHASQGEWAGTHPQSYSYAWERCVPGSTTCSPVVGGTSPTLQLTDQDLGYRMRVTVTATNASGSAASTSAPSDVVADATAPDTPRMLEPQRTVDLSPVLKVAWTSIGTDITYDARYRLATPQDDFGSHSILSEDIEQNEASIRPRLGATYCFSVRSRDTAGNESPWSAERCTTIPLDDQNLSENGSWTSGDSGRFFRGTFTETKQRGARLDAGRVRVRGVHLLALRCPRCGSVKVLSGRTVLAKVDLRAPRSGTKLIHVARFSSARKGRVKIVVTSSQRLVRIDGIALKSGGR